jgi:FHA domain-containing protein
VSALLAEAVPEAVLTVLKFCFLALVFLFLARVVRVVVLELRSPVGTPVGGGGGGAPAGKAGKPAKRAGAHLKILEPAEHRGETYPLGDELTVGRGGGCGVVLPEDSFVSTVHARLFRRGDDLFVEDLGSRNGTFVDGKRISGPTKLTGGETIKVGQTEIATELVPTGAAATKVSASPPPPPPPPPAEARTEQQRAEPPPPQFGPPGGPPPPPGRKRKGFPLWLGLTVGAVVILAGLAAWFFLVRASAVDQIDEAVQQVFVVADPDACDFFTTGYYEEVGELSDQTADEAEQTCRDAEDVVASDSATVTDLEVDGDTATGTIEFTAEGQDQTIPATFADEDGWKIDSLDYDAATTE